MDRKHHLIIFGRAVVALFFALGIGISISATARDFVANSLAVELNPKTATGLGSTPSQRSDKSQFRVFDGTLFKNKPDFAPYNIGRIEVIYASEIWADPAKYPELPDRVRVKIAAAKRSTPGSIVVIDVEHWPVTGKDEKKIAEGIDKYLKLISWVRESSPNLRIGYYGHPPVTDYWRAIKGMGSNEGQSWVHDNDRIQSIADAVDILFPSLYTFYTDKEAWVTYAKAQIAEARRMAKGKPVYVFLWPQYHDSNYLLGCHFLPADYWRLELETASQYADGAVIWGGWDVCNPKGRALPWDENAEWWQVTKKFLAANKIAK